MVRGLLRRRTSLVENFGHEVTIVHSIMVVRNSVFAISSLSCYVLMQCMHARMNLLFDEQ